MDTLPKTHATPPSDDKICLYQLLINMHSILKHLLTLIIECGTFRNSTALQPAYREEKPPFLIIPTNTSLHRYTRKAHSKIKLIQLYRPCMGKNSSESLKSWAYTDITSISWQDIYIWHDQTTQKFYKSFRNNNTIYLSHFFNTSYMTIYAR